jgi:hypothetical protein
MARKPSINPHREVSAVAFNKYSKYASLTSIAPLWCLPTELYTGNSFERQSSRFVPPEVSVYKLHLLSRLRSALRLLIIVLSGGVAMMLVHTLHIYRGNTYLDLRKGELPMTWPAHTNLAPTLLLFSAASANFFVSVAILSMSLTKSFRQSSRDIYQVVAGSLEVVLWATALVSFDLLNKASKASLRQHACTNKNVISNSRYQYRALCQEQVRQRISFRTHMLMCY